jgi:hypothetical protein
MYLTINGTEYLVRVGDGRGRVAQVENRRRALDGSLLVDTIADKREIPIQITGASAAGRFFTPSEADALIATLMAGNVTIGGDAAGMTARARDIGWEDGSDWTGGSPVTFRWVSATLEEV